MSDIVLRNIDSTAISKVREENGNVAQLTAVERKLYYLEMCRVYNLDPLSFPFDYIKQDDKLKLYVNSIGAAQMRDRFKVSTRIKNKEIIEDIWVVTCEAQRGERTEEATGAAAFCDKYGKITPTAKANALKKAETQARRRATLAICGWGFDDDDNGQILQAKTYDPPVDVITLPSPQVHQPTWKSWKGPSDAINWAKTLLPDASEEYINRIMLETQPDGSGKKAPNFYDKVCALAQYLRQNGVSQKPCKIIGFLKK